MSTKFHLVCSDHKQSIETDYSNQEHAEFLWNARDTLMMVFAEVSQGREIARKDYGDAIEVEVLVFGKRIRLDIEEFLVNHCVCNVKAIS